MTEPLVSLEVAKLLKDKGFNEWCEWAIDDKGEMYDLDAFTELGRLNKLHPVGFYSMTTQALAQKWLWESKGILVLVVLDSKGLRYNITRKNVTVECADYHLSYEGTLEEGLKQALKLI